MVLSSKDTASAEPSLNTILDLVKASSSVAFSLISACRPSINDLLEANSDSKRASISFNSFSVPVSPNLISTAFLTCSSNSACLALAAASAASLAC